jgi:hypothetical protein
MRSSELRALEAKRVEERDPRRVVHRDPKPANGWDPRTIRNEIEAEMRSCGATVWREERP